MLYSNTLNKRNSWKFATTMKTLSSNEQLTEHVNRMKDGDKKSFDWLFLKFYPYLRVYAQRFVGKEDAEEVVQDIMMNIWINREKLNIEVNIQHYLLIAVKNRCLSLISRDTLKRNIFSLINLEAEEIWNDPDFYILDELREKIEQAIQSLPETYRYAFEQNRFNNKSYQNLADEEGVSVKTIDYRIQQALKILRKELKKYLHLLFL